jgi:phosphoribosyl-ATP pyrophosphohydrolase
MSDSLSRLYQAIQHARQLSPVESRTARLLEEGMLKIARKVGEEAIEVALDAVEGQRGRVIAESADLLYNLTVLWVEMNISPDDVWSEMNRRESTFGIAEKEPKLKAL